MIRAYFFTNGDRFQVKTCGHACKAETKDFEKICAVASVMEDILLEQLSANRSFTTAHEEDAKQGYFRLTADLKKGRETGMFGILRAEVIFSAIMDVYLKLEATYPESVEVKVEITGGERDG